MAEAEIMNSIRKNFSSYEKELILALVAKYKNIIENKRTNATTIKQKRDAWEKIEKEFNSIPGIRRRRNYKQLWDCYKNMKKKAMKDRANEKIEMYRTGGSISETQKSDEIGERLLSMDVIMQPLQNSCCRDAKIIQPACTEPTENQQDFIEVTTATTTDAQEDNVHNILATEPIKECILEMQANENYQVRNNIRSKKRSAEAAYAIFEQATTKKALLEKKAKLEMKCFEEKHKLEMEILQSQLKINKKILDLLENNPSCLQLHINK